MVAFRYDDPNRPFVLGSLFHGKSGTGGGSSNKTKSLTTRSGCTITLDDEKGSVMMKDKEGNSYTADGEGNITISASKSITLCVGENKIMIDSEGNISSNAEKGHNRVRGCQYCASRQKILIVQQAAIIISPVLILQQPAAAVPRSAVQQRLR